MQYSIVNDIPNYVTIKQLNKVKYFPFLFPYGLFIVPLHLLSKFY